MYVHYVYTLKSQQQSNIRGIELYEYYCCSLLQLSYLLRFRPTLFHSLNLGREISQVLFKLYSISKKSQI